VGVHPTTGSLSAQALCSGPMLLGKASRQRPAAAPDRPVRLRLTLPTSPDPAGEVPCAGRGGQQPGLDPRHLGERRDPQPRHHLALERLGPAQLADARHDAVELSENGHRPLHARGLPSGGRLERREYCVEARPQVLECGHQRLQVTLRSQQALPVRQLIGLHAAIVAPPRSPRGRRGPGRATGSSRALLMFRQKNRSGTTSESSGRTRSAALEESAGFHGG